MTFPLPTGVCRPVCRPNRKEPRLIRLKDAVRLAKAAVDNGDDPCDVSKAVFLALRCRPCERELQDLVEGRDLLIQAWRQVREKLATILRLVGLGTFADQLVEDEEPSTGEPINPENIPSGSFWGRLWRRFLWIVRLVAFLQAIGELVTALLLYNQRLAQFLNALADYLTCLESTNAQ